MTNDYDGEAWWYVGRFMSSFATIEAGVDRALYELFDLDLILYSLLTSNLELRKKLIFVRAAMEQQGVQDSAVVKKIHKLHDIRNMLAHSQFTISDEGIDFGYSGKQPGSEKFEAKEKTYLGHFISYSQLDSYEKEMSHIEDELIRIGASLSPITESERFARDVEKIIEKSENIIRFTRPPEKE